VERVAIRQLDRLRGLRHREPRDVSRELAGARIAVVMHRRIHDTSESIAHTMRMATLTPTDGIERTPGPSANSGIALYVVRERIEDTEEVGMRRTRMITVLVPALILVATLAGVSLAAKPGPGTSTGTARVFSPNPVASLQDQTLTDQGDADYPALQAAYVTVTLTDLDGGGYLRGDWANIRSATGPDAYSPDNTFLYDRHDDRFEQVMAYYWVTEAQKYIQSLGFGTTLRPVNMESQDIRINQWGVDNSYSWDKHDVLRFGKGGVDDAEDAEVIVHEYGHAIQDSQMTPFGGFGTSAEAGAIGEGFGDYWAVTVSDVVAPTADPACVADWDSVSYTTSTPHCLRRVDTDLHYPTDLNGRVHHDGQIWSRALWDIRAALGHIAADTIILEAQFSFAPDTSMPAAATATVNAASSLYGSAAANAVLGAFQARGILP